MAMSKSSLVFNEINGLQQKEDFPNPPWFSMKSMAYSGRRIKEDSHYPPYPVFGAENAELAPDALVILPIVRPYREEEKVLEKEDRRMRRKSSYPPCFVTKSRTYSRRRKSSYPPMYSMKSMVYKEEDCVV